jgi:eukaryotic-like serine/threonine-protein kinase
MTHQSNDQNDIQRMSELQTPFAAVQQSHTSVGDEIIRSRGKDFNEWNQGNDTFLLLPLHEVITFYSYKGGTGRTMALANIACLFAKSDMRVLAIDWDLEAPGLHYYLGLPSDPADKPSSSGVVEYFTQVGELIGGATPEDAEDTNAKRILSRIPYQRYCHQTDVNNVTLMPAGCLDSTYQTRLAKIDWVGLYEKVPGVFRNFAGRIAADYDVVLVDARTGMTDISSICTALLPDKLVLVFTPNQQSLVGVESLVSNSIRYRQESRDIRSLTVYPLPSRIDAERDKLRQVWRFGGPGSLEGFQPQFERILCSA